MGNNMQELPVRSVRFSLTKLLLAATVLFGGLAVLLPPLLGWAESPPLPHVPEEAIFADGFEGGDTRQWLDTSPPPTDHFTEISRWVFFTASFLALMLLIYTFYLTRKIDRLLQELHRKRTDGG